MYCSDRVAFDSSICSRLCTDLKNDSCVLGVAGWADTMTVDTLLEVSRTTASDDDDTCGDHKEEGVCFETLATNDWLICVESKVSGVRVVLNSLILSLAAASPADVEVISVVGGSMTLLSGSLIVVLLLVVGVLMAESADKISTEGPCSELLDEWLADWADKLVLSLCSPPPLTREGVSCISKELVVVMDCDAVDEISTIGATFSECTKS